MKGHSWNQVAWDRRAFSLIEILVAVGIAAVLIAMLARMLGVVTYVTSSQKGRMDSLTETRSVLDRISLDWVGRIRRSDIPLVSSGTSCFLLPNQNGDNNDQISFISRVPAFSGTRKYSMVSYRIKNSVLQRGVVGYVANASDPHPDNNPTLDFPFNAPVVPENCFDKISGTVFRLEFCYMVKSVAAGGTNSVVFTNAAPADPTNVMGIVVAIGTIDENTRKILSSGQMDALTVALKDAGANTDPQSQWLQTVNNANFAVTAGIPQAAARGVHIYQRVLLNCE